MRALLRASDAASQVAAVAERLLQREVLNHKDMVELVGERQFPNESSVDLSLFGGGANSKPRASKPAVAAS